MEKKKVSSKRISEQINSFFNSCNIDPNEQFWVEFCLKKWKFVSRAGGHRAVIIKMCDRNLVFQVDLILDKEKQYGFSVPFECKDYGCEFETKSFREYNSHYLQHCNRGENILHTCCDREFTQYVMYTKHLHENHRNSNPIGINFERIDTEKRNNVLSKESTSFFPSGLKKISFGQIHMNAYRILQNFGKYTIFFWNCHDFATWFLHYHGVPLAEIEPTLTDKSSASGTDSCARAIRDRKQKWYTDDPIKNDEIDLDLKHYGTGYTCIKEECRYLPPMSMEDLKVHDRLSHQKIPEETCYQTARRFVGSDVGPDINMEDARTFSLFKLCSGNPKSLTSIVLQPWTTVGISQQKDHYCEWRRLTSNTMSSTRRCPSSGDLVKCCVTSVKDNGLEHIFDFKISLAKLYILYNSEKYAVSGSTNYSKFADEVIRKIKLKSTITKESPVSWPTWRSMHFTSLARFLRKTSVFLPLLILISRTTSFFDMFTFLMLSVIIISSEFLFGPFAMQISYLKMHGMKHIGGDNPPVIIELMCEFASIGFLFFAAVNPGNISSAITYYHIWIIICTFRFQKIGYYRMNQNVNASGNSFISASMHIYGACSQIQINSILLYLISYVANYQVYLIMQIVVFGLMIIIEMYQSISGITGQRSLFPFPRYSFVFYTTSISIAVVGFFFEPVRYDLESYPRSCLIPFIVYVCWYVSRDYVIAAKTGMHIDERITAIKRYIFPLDMKCSIDKSAQNEMSLNDEVTTTLLALQIFAYINYLRFLYVPVIIGVFLTSSIETVIITKAAVLWLYTVSAVAYMNLQTSFGSKFFENLFVILQNGNNPNASRGSSTDDSKEVE